MCCQRAPNQYTEACTNFTTAQRPRSAPDMQAKASMLVVGLANSGKTSIVQALKAERNLDDTVPTVGFSVERFHMLNTMLTVVDMSGQPKYQKLWECYYDDVQVCKSPLHLSALACLALHFAGSSCCKYSPTTLQHMQQPRHGGLPPGGCGTASASPQRG